MLRRFGDYNVVKPEVASLLGHCVGKILVFKHARHRVARVYHGERAAVIDHGFLYDVAKGGPNQ